MMRICTRWTCAATGLLLVAGCRLAAPRQPGRREAARANQISNKHILTESPTREQAAPTPVPAP